MPALATARAVTIRVEQVCSISYGKEQSRMQRGREGEDKAKEEQEEEGKKKKKKKKKEKV